MVDIKSVFLSNSSFILPQMVPPESEQQKEAEQRQTDSRQHHSETGSRPFSGLRNSLYNNNWQCILVMDLGAVTFPSARGALRGSVAAETDLH